jgi:thiol-disulfide isomerase/thioredoxin
MRAHAAVVSASILLLLLLSPLPVLSKQQEKEEASGEEEIDIGLPGAVLRALLRSGSRSPLPESAPEPSPTTSVKMKESLGRREIEEEKRSEKNKQRQKPAGAPEAQAEKSSSDVSVPRIPRTTLVVFHAPWCGHCKALLPRVTAAAGALAKDFDSSLFGGESDLRAVQDATSESGWVRASIAAGRPLAFAAVDCTADKGVCQSFHVQGYPTMIVLRRVPWRVPAAANARALGIDADADPSAVASLDAVLGAARATGPHDGGNGSHWLVSPFEGRRTRADIEGFGAAVLAAGRDAAGGLQSFTDLSSAVAHASDAQLVAQGMVSFVLVRPEGAIDDAPIAQDFADAASALGGVARFLEVVVGESERGLGDSADGSRLMLDELVSGAHVVRVDPQFDAASELFSTAVGGSVPVGQWMWDRRHPTLSPFNSGLVTRAAVQRRKIVLGIVGTLDMPGQRLADAPASAGSRMLAALRDVAREEKPEFAFAFADATRHMAMVTDMEMDAIADVPFMAVIDGDAGVHYLLSFNQTNLVADGSVKRTAQRLRQELEDVEAGRVEARGDGATLWGMVKRNQFIIPIVTLVVLAGLMFLVFVVCYDEDEDDEDVPGRRANLPAGRPKKD